MRWGNSSEIAFCLCTHTARRTSEIVKNVYADTKTKMPKSVERCETKTKVETCVTQLNEIENKNWISSCACRSQITSDATRRRSEWTLHREKAKNGTNELSNTPSTSFNISFSVQFRSRAERPAIWQWLHDLRHSLCIKIHGASECVEMPKPINMKKRP